MSFSLPSPAVPLITRVCAQAMTFPVEQKLEAAESAEERRRRAMEEQEFAQTIADDDDDDDGDF